MVAAVRCPNAKCRKFMLVEEADQGAVVACLICKQPIKVPAAAGQSPPPPGRDLTPIFDDDGPQFKPD